MVQLVGAGVVQVFSLQVDLCPAQEIGKCLAVVDRGGTTLKIPADAAELRDELRGLGDGVVAFRVLIERLDQLRIFQIVAAVFSKISVLGRVFLQVVVEIPVFVHVILSFQ